MDFKIKRLDVFRHNETGEEVTLTIVSLHHVKAVGTTINKTFGFTDFKKKFTFIRRG